MIRTFATASALAALLALAAATPAPGQAPSGDEARQEVVLRAPGAADGADALLAFRGEIATTTVPWPPGGARLGPLEGFMVAYLQALGSETPEEAFSFWAPEERQAIRERIDEAFLERSQAFVRSIRRIRFLGRVDYGEYRILLAEVETAETTVVRVYPLVRRGDELYRTDALSDDIFASTLGRSLAATLAEGGQEGP